MAGFKNLEDLVADLSDGLRKLRAGALEPEELTPLVEDARELSDRLILLRFKAHEFSYEVRRKAPESGVDPGAADRQPVRPFRIGAAYQTSLIDAIEEVSREQVEQAEKARMDAGTPELFDAPVPEPVPVPKPVPVPEPAPAPAPDPPQALEPPPAPEPTPVPEPVPAPEWAAPEAPAPLVFEPIVSEPVEEELSLAPASETEEGTEAAVPETLAAAVEVPEPDKTTIAEAPLESGTSGSLVGPNPDGSPSLAEQMERQPISDLRTAFSLVEKYECIKMLFADDAVEFNRVLEALEEAGNFELALHWLGQQVAASKDWDKEDPVVMRFLDRVERRYH